MKPLTTAVMLIVAGCATVMAQTPSVTFLGMDVTTLGNWKGVYGQDGFVLADYSLSTPSYSGFNAVNVNMKLLDIWSCSEGHACDPRQLLKQPYSYTSAERVEAYYYNRFTDDFQVNATDGKPHRIALYFCDYEFYGRSVTVIAHNTATGAVLDTRPLYDYSGGVYLVYNYTGNVDFEVVDNIGPKTPNIPNGTVSGFFWGGSGFANPAPPGPTVNFSPVGVTSGSTVSGTVPLQVALVDGPGVTSVQLQLDGQNLGSPMTYFVTNPLASPVILPFNYSWDTRTTTNCIHTLTAIATDANGYQAASPGLTVTVNNGPANCGSGPTTVAAPIFNPAPGGYNTAQNVALSTTTAGASIRYTTDGVTTPTETVGTLYVAGSPIPVSTTTTIQALAYKSGMADSPVITGTYTINSGGGGTGGPVAFVQSNATASSMPGSFSQSVAFPASVTAGNTIFVFAQYYNAPVAANASDSCNNQYTQITGSPVSAGTSGTAHWFIARNVNGGICTVTVSYSSDARYAGVSIFEVSGLGNATLDQYASGTGNGSLATASIAPTQANSFAIAQVWSGGGGGVALGGNWTTQERLRFSTLYQSNLAGWQVLNWAVPASLSTQIGGGPWIAMVANFYNSGGGGGGQVAAPTFNPPAGAYTTPITIGTTTSGATIRYTTDGSTPTATYGTVYGGPVALTATTTLKAIAYKSGMTDSSVSTAIYTVSSGTVATPTFNPPPGPYTAPVAISTTTPGATIRYTLDNSTPTETYGTIYTGAIPLTSTTTIQAIAYASGYVDSAVASGTYTIGSPVTNGALVQSNATASVFPGNGSQSVVFPANVTPGNTIFVFAQYYGSATTATATDTCGDVFQEITGSPVVNTSGDKGAAHWFIARNVAGGACTVKVTYSSPTRYGGVAIFEVSGLGGLNVTLDRYASGSGTGSTASATITPTRASSFAIAQVWSDGGGGYSLGSSWTAQERVRFSTLYQSNLAGWQVLTSTGAVSVSAPVGYGPWIAMIANFYAQ